VKPNLTEYRQTELFKVRDALDVLIDKEIHLYDEKLFQQIYNDINEELEKRAYR